MDKIDNNIRNLICKFINQYDNGQVIVEEYDFNMYTVKLRHYRLINHAWKKTIDNFMLKEMIDNVGIVTIYNSFCSYVFLCSVCKKYFIADMAKRYIDVKCRMCK